MGLLVLASASPRRRELLAEMGLDCTVVPSHFDEASIRHLPTGRQAEAAALGKADEVHHRCPGAWVLGADTIVALDGQSLGKPANAAEAAAMLARLAGRDHSVVSSVALIAPDGRRLSGSGISRVRLRPLTAAQIDAYLAGSEALDKAGAYAIQGAASAFASLVRGRRDTVVGLPGHALARLFRELAHPAARHLARAAEDRRSANLHRP